jgi:hypothetical protein
MVAVTADVAVLIIETVFEPELVTYARCPSGLTATPHGVKPTLMGEVSAVAAAVWITDTELALLLATYTVLPSGVIATPRGFPPMGIDATTGVNPTAVAVTVGAVGAGGSPVGDGVSAGALDGGSCGGDGYIGAPRSRSVVTVQGEWQRRQRVSGIAGSAKGC